MNYDEKLKLQGQVTLGRNLEEWQEKFIDEWLAKEQKDILQMLAIVDSDALPIVQARHRVLQSFKAYITSAINDKKRAEQKLRNEEVKP